MIPVAEQPEYPEFNSRVRQRGQNLLASHPGISGNALKNYWKHAAPHLHAAYGCICAYTSIYLPEQGSVDHYLPKDTHPHLAYEWSNYRLASQRVNSAKGNSASVLDPFLVQDDWFFLEVPSCLIRPNPALDPDLRNQISQTVNILRLNQDDNYVQDRCSLLIDFARGHVTLDFLDRRYPFLAKEIRRQGFTQEELATYFVLEA